MKKRIRLGKLTLWLCYLFFIGTLLVTCFGCTARQETAIKTGAGVVGTFLGLPPALGESLAGLVLIATHAAAMKLGHRRGRKSKAPPHPLIPKVG